MLEKKQVKKKEIRKIALCSSQGSLGRNRGTEKAPFYLYPKKKYSKIFYETEDLDKYNKEIEKYFKQKKNWSGKFIGIGGDHSITYPIVKAIKKQKKNLNLIVFDSHTDCYDYFKPPSHEDFIKVLIKDKIFKPEEILIVGANKIYPRERKFLEKEKIKVIKSKEIKEREKEIKDFLKKPFYMSIDIDVIKEMATHYKEKNAILEKEFLQLLKELNLKKAVGFDIVEINPLLDKKKTTKKTAKKIVKILESKIKN